VDIVTITIIARTEVNNIIFDSKISPNRIKENLKFNFFVIQEISLDFWAKF